jgi:oxalate decarboxylase/phosphoglucose isomerase-like protein (cupin superfamily)
LIVQLTGERDAQTGEYLASKRVALEPAHADARGYIQALVNVPVHNVSLIMSKKGTVRSNHYHKTDWHYIYVISGAFDYYFRRHGSSDNVRQFACKEGDMIWTPPMEDHTTVFTQDTVILALSLLPRDQEAYESDVVRIVLVDPKTLQLGA